MNIEESIKPLKILMSKYKQIDEMNNFDHELALVIDYTELSAIETLLTAYEKLGKDYNWRCQLAIDRAKEIEELNLKSEKLYEDNLTLAQEIKEFIEGTNDVKYYSTSFIKNHYISKDKIKVKIEEVQKRLEEETRKDFLIILKILENELQSLLEKE